ncbi:hypothetical protein [Actinomadura roseirufa]|uniref:hypothetical protein n=1 Tax=Actinomadura roseirufa TaxID=2094049 RepID=UPI00104105D6|nr:hypothetical protein [Actinomadura roseirufa]
MSHVDDRLTEALHDEGWALPVPPGTLDAIESRSRWMRRRRRLGMAAGAVAAVTAVAVVSARLPSGDSGGGPVAASRSLNTFTLRGLGDRSSGPVLLNGALYIRKRNGDVVKVNPRSGKIVKTGRPNMVPMVPKFPISPGSLTASMFVSGGSLWMFGFHKRQFAIYRLDPGTLRTTLKVVLPPGFYMGLAATPDSIWAVGDDGRNIYRMDGRTGAVVGRFTMRPPLLSDVALVSVDEKAGVAWMSGLSKNGGVVLAARIRPGTLTVVGEEPHDASTVLNAVVPGGDGSLWAGSRGSLDRWAPEAAGSGLKRLPVDGGLASAWAAGGAQLGLAGGRLWAARPNAAFTTGSLLCLDHTTGRTLETYKLVANNGKSVVNLLPTSGDAHQVYLSPGRDVLELHGPDRCLS